MSSQFSFSEFLPPLPTGILLDQRYNIEKVLTQNHDGNTYLAKDLIMLTGPIVIEEVRANPKHLNLLATKRTDGLQEAQSSYSYEDSPCFPRFSELFCDLDRTFLIRPYILGMTLQKYSQDISENTLIVWLEALLKSLSKLHQANLYYNNIAPENIVIESGANMPILINFNCIEVLVPDPSEDNLPMPTVSKLNEQVYAVDLYALAVLAVSLLTQADFHSLMTTRNWIAQWENNIANNRTVTAEFAAILNRMLLFKAQVQYQSADAILRALFELPIPD
ncbi:MAG: serine/threonine-protein kinase [Cyanobacteria bacterium J06555_13]